MTVWTFYFLNVHHDGDVSVVSETHSTALHPENVLREKLNAFVEAFVTAPLMQASLDSFIANSYDRALNRDVLRQSMERDGVLTRCLGMMANAAFERAAGVTIEEIEARVAGQFPGLAR